VAGTRRYWHAAAIVAAPPIPPAFRRRRNAPPTASIAPRAPPEQRAELRCLAADAVRAGAAASREDAPLLVCAAALLRAAPPVRGGNGDRGVFRGQRPDWNLDPFGLLDGRAVSYNYRSSVLPAGQARLSRRDTSKVATKSESRLFRNKRQ
jgi:hypothetical protein